MNDHLMLISGMSKTGKSTSLRNLKNPKGVMYLNAEGRKLAFKNEFMELNVVDPLQVNEAFLHAETLPDIHTIIVDSFTFLLDMYESMYVLPSPDGRKAWGDFAQFGKQLIQQYVANSTKNVFFTAHTLSVFNETEMIIETKVPVKGALKNNGIEALFPAVISTKKMALRDLEKYSSKLLTITKEEEILGFKYVYQTKLTKETVHERISTPIGMFTTDESFIDNDLQLVIDRLHQYYI